MIGEEETASGKSQVPESEQAVVSPVPSPRGHVLLWYGAKVVRSIRVRLFRAPKRALVVTVLGVCLAAAGLNLWAWQHLREANRLVEQQQYSKAYGQYAQCLRIWRWSAPTHLLAGRTARRAGRYEEAEAHLAQCQKLQGATSLPLALEHLLLQAQSGDISEVEDVLWGELKKKNADAPLILEGLARAYARMLRMGTATRCWRMLLEREPNNIDALLNLGRLLEFTDPEEAVKDYHRALELNPERDDVRVALAQHLLRKSPELARPQFEYVIARQPDNREALLGLVQVYRASGESEKVGPLLDVLLERQPNDSKALGELGTLALSAGQIVAGEALLRKAVRADPTNVDAQYQLYLCLVQQPGREADAATQRDLHKRADEDNTRLIQLASKDMNLAPNDPKLHYEMGVIFLRNGKPDVGIRWLHSAVKLDPGHQASHQALHEYYLHIGDTDRAEQHRTQPSSPPAKSSSK